MACCILRRDFGAVSRRTSQPRLKAQVVTRLFNRLGGDGGKLTVAAVDQPFVEGNIPRVHQILAGDRVGEVAVRLFCQQ